MNTIKLLALDLDGTLVADLNTIPARTRTAIQAAGRQGVQVTIATGREWGVTRRFVHMLGLTTPVICYQGALIVDPQSGRPIASESLPLPLAHRLIDLARREHLALHLYLDNHAYIEHPSAQSRAIFSRMGATVVEVPDLKQVITRPPLKGLIVHPAGDGEALAGRLQTALGSGLSVFRSLDVLIEVTSPQVSKGRALATLARHAGVLPQEVMAIGDQDNDIDMIAWAGLGVAMGNASPGAKAAADYIAPPISRQGAAWAIEQFILKRGKPHSPIS